MTVTARQKEVLQMPRHMRLDDQDKRALRALDSDFVISADGETATVAGEMEVEIVRDGVEQFRLRFKFPSDELLDVKSAAAGTTRH